MQTQMIPTLEEALSGTLFGSGKPDDKKVVMLDPNELIEIEDQPFRPYPPEKLAELADDIKENGQINPCTVRKKDGKYIVLAGRNRKRACERAGLKVSCILIECDDATANLVLVNSNLNQRQELLPSEKAFAYKLQKESYEAKGQKKTEAAVAEQNSENVKKIQRYIKLTKLPKDLLDMVDSGRLPITVGVEFAYMPKSDMETVSAFLANHEQLSVSVDHAQQIRKLSPDLSVTELDHLFLFDGAANSDPDANEPTDKKEKAPQKAVSSVTIKLEELEQLNCSFDFANAKKAEIREFIINSLEAHFGSVYDC